MAKTKKTLHEGTEREYVVPLRKAWLKVPKYRRAEKAITALRLFVARHMRVPNRDVSLVKVDTYLNEEIWFRGIKSPPAKIKVKVRKDKENYIVSLAEIPAVVKYKMDREKRLKDKAEKTKPQETPTPVETKTEESAEKKEEFEEKKEAVKESMEKLEKDIHKQQKHQTVDKKVRPHRMALQK